jgi:hypothetical protein
MTNKSFFDYPITEDYGAIFHVLLTGITLIAIIRSDDNEQMVCQVSKVPNSDKIQFMTKGVLNWIVQEKSERIGDYRLDHWKVEFSSKCQKIEAKFISL